MERKIRVYSRKTVNRISSDNLQAMAKLKAKVELLNIIYYINWKWCRVDTMNDWCYYNK